MNKYTILIVDDEREVLDSSAQDLEPLSSKFDIEIAESAEEAEQLIDALENEKRVLALILCDHVMPGEKGVDFLIKLHNKDSTKHSKKLLLTGQAGHSDTIKAINQGHLDYYIAKPWTAEELVKIVKDQLTSFIIARETDLANYTDVLDATRLYEAIYNLGSEPE